MAKKQPTRARSLTFDDWPYSRQKPYAAVVEWPCFSRDLWLGKSIGDIPNAFLFDCFKLDASATSASERMAQELGGKYSPAALVFAGLSLPMPDGESKSSRMVVGAPKGHLIDDFFMNVTDLDEIMFTEKDNLFIAFSYYSRKQSWYHERNSSSRWSYEEGKLPDAPTPVVASSVINLSFASLSSLAGDIGERPAFSHAVASGIFDSKREAEAWSKRVSVAFAKEAEDAPKGDDLDAWDTFCSGVLSDHERYVLHTKKANLLGSRRIHFDRTVKVDPMKLMKLVGDVMLPWPNFLPSLGSGTKRCRQGPRLGCETSLWSRSEPFSTAGGLCLS